MYSLDFRRFLIAAQLVFFFFSSASLLAQAPPDVAQGLKLYDSYQGGAIDNVSLTNGNLFVHADLMAYSQRGGELAYPVVLEYNGKSFSLFQKTCPPPPPGNPIFCPVDLVFGPPTVHQDKSLGNTVVIGFEGEPGIASGAAGFGISTGLSDFSNPIFVQPYSALTRTGLCTNS